MKKKYKRIFKSRFVRLIIILIFIAVCIAIGSAVAYVKHESDPTEDAVIYFRAFVQKDYDKMYDCISFDESDYVNKDRYKDTVKKVREKLTIDSYKVKEPIKTDGMWNVTFACEDLETNTSEDFIVYLTEKRETYHIIPKYEINIEHMMADNFSVTIPKEDTLEINGEKITGSRADVKTEGAYRTYTFKHILNGEYKIASANEYCVKNETVKIAKDNKKIDLSKKEYEVNEKYTKMSAESSESIMKEFYKAVRDRKPSSKQLMEFGAEDKKLQKKLKGLVKESQEIVYWSDVKNMDSYYVSEMDMSKIKYSLTFDSEKKEFTMLYKYNYDYVLKTKTAVYNSYAYKLSGKCKSTMKLKYVLHNKGIKLTDMEITNKNKKNEV